MQKRTIVEWVCLICGYTTIIKPVNERVCPACNTGPAAGWSAKEVEERWEPTEESLRAAGHAEIDFGNFEDAKILFEWADHLAQKKLDADRESAMEGGD